jgi:hypothetical protein
LRVFFGGESGSSQVITCFSTLLLGGHDNGYSSTLTALDNERLLGKLVILQGYSEVANELQKLSLPSLKVDGLFMTHKLPHIAKKPTQLVTPTVSVGTITNGEFTSPRSSEGSGGRLIDSSLVHIIKVAFEM